MNHRSPSTEAPQASGFRDEASELARLGKSLLPRACENCRIRKIRCDKSSPCSSCQMVNLPCKVVAKIVDNRSRASPTNYHERHFNLIHESLLEIKEKLRKIEQNNTSHESPLDVHVAPTDQKSPYVLETIFQGESSFDSHSTQAALSAELSAKEPNVNDLDQEVQTSLSAIKSFLKSQRLPSPVNDLCFPNFITHWSTSNAELPPMSAVLAVIKMTTEQPPLVVLHCGLRNHSMLGDLCEKIYFPRKPFSKGELTLMNGMLFYVFREYSKKSDENFAPFDMPKWSKLCEKNFVSGLQDYECLVNPTLENIQCLMIGAMKAQEDARPYLCWTFVSMGARLCQILGYHREVVVARDPPNLADAKRHVFWMLYMMDKNLSLNLGWTSSFPDYDIDTNVFSPSSDPRFRPWDHTMIAFIELSRLQSQLYDKLYSVRARREPPEVRSQVIEELAEMYSSWHLKFKEIETSGSQDKSDLDLIIGSSDFIYYSILNLLYGAKASPESATRISSKRYEAARLSLQCHVQNWAKLPSSDIAKWIYSEWILLYSSFTPFFVVFTHSIASHSQEDVALLAEVLNTLEAIRSTSETLNQLCQMCRVFLGFAKAFLQSQQPSFGFYNEADNSFTFSATGAISGSYEHNQTPYSMGGDGAESRNGDLDSMSAFLGVCLGDNSAIGGLWDLDFSGTQSM